MKGSRHSYRYSQIPDGFSLAELNHNKARELYFGFQDDLTDRVRSALSYADLARNAGRRAVAETYATRAREDLAWVESQWTWWLKLCRHLEQDAPDLHDQERHIIDRAAKKKAAAQEILRQLDAKPRRQPRRKRDPTTDKQESLLSQGGRNP